MKDASATKLGLCCIAMVSKKHQKRNAADAKNTSADDARGGSSAWGKSLYERERETLPIKKADGKVVRQIVSETVQESDEGSDGEEGEGQGQQGEGFSAAFGGSGGGEVVAEESDNEYEFQPDFDEEDNEKGLSGAWSEGEDNDAGSDAEAGNAGKQQGGARKEHKRRRDQKGSKKVDSDDSDFNSDSDSDTPRGKAQKKAEAAEAAKKEKKEKKEETKHTYLKALAKLPTAEVMQHVGNICRGVLDSPELALKRRAPGKDSPLLAAAGDTDEDADYKLLDLFDVLSAKENGAALFQPRVVEMAMLSTLLIFKDIVPAYRIRPLADTPKTGKEVEVKLKKQTKALRDFELALLGAYQRFLKMLDSFASTGLGNLAAKGGQTKHVKAASSGTTSQLAAKKLGLSALRCQCELMVNLLHFNFRQKLLSAVVRRAAQTDKEAGNLARESLVSLFAKDKQGEASLECVKLMAACATAVKFRSIPEEFIQCLFSMRLEVRAEDARALKMKAKKERRKRKRAEDDIATQMTENSVALEKVTTQKLQANTLHEISLIYFRIVKGKIGYDLLPCALEGLGRIAHLLNFETMEELTELMRGLVSRKEDGGSALPAPIIQLQCIRCALRVLSGPGESLAIDVTFFANRLATLVYQLPAAFDRWDVVLECIEMCFGKRKDDRTAPIQAFIKILLQSAGHQQSSTGGVTVLAMAHSMLLQHPRLRSRYASTGPGQAKTKALFEEDDEVGDMAMQALRTGLDNSTGDTNVLDSTTTVSENGSWMVSLLLQHADPMVRHVVSSLVSKDINPLPVRLPDAKFEPIVLLNRADSALDGVSKMLDQASSRRAKAQSKNHKQAEQKALYRRQEGYKEDTERHWKAIKHVHHMPEAKTACKALRSLFA